jgi:hypothetical protein
MFEYCEEIVEFNESIESSISVKSHSHSSEVDENETAKSELITHDISIMLKIFDFSIIMINCIAKI